MNEISEYSQGLHEECGVFGIYDKTGETDMVSAVYSALYALQHRGQESCGIALNVDGVLTGYRDLGLVSEVFTPRVLADLPQDAKMATGHVRYATAGSGGTDNIQPFIFRFHDGDMALCHNGNLTNCPSLRRKLEDEGAIFHSNSDTEVLMHLIRRSSKPTFMDKLKEAIDKLQAAENGEQLSIDDVSGEASEE